MQLHKGEFHERKYNMKAKTLIVYYSLFQNTANLALEVALQTGGTLRELIPDKNYSFDYNTAAKEVRNEISRGFGRIEDDIASERAESIILPGIAVNGTAAPEELTKWLEKIGYE